LCAGGWAGYQYFQLQPQRDHLRKIGEQRKTTACAQVRGAIAETIDWRTSREREIGKATGFQRVAAAFEARARTWKETLRRHLAAGVARDPAELGALLVAARGRLQPLRELTTNSRLPAEVQQRLHDALSEMISGAQQNLEHSVRRQAIQAVMCRAVQRYERDLPELKQCQRVIKPSALQGQLRDKRAKHNGAPAQLVNGDEAVHLRLPRSELGQDTSQTQRGA
jgi:hypothetical protein